MNIESIYRETDKDYILMGRLLYMREEVFKNRVLRGKRMNIPVVRQLCAMVEYMGRKRLLSVSLSEMIDHGVYKTWRYSRNRLASHYMSLVEVGTLIKSTRDSRSHISRRPVVVFSLTQEAMGIVRAYYAYMGGAYDKEVREYMSEQEYKSPMV